MCHRAQQAGCAQLGGGGGGGSAGAPLCVRRQQQQEGVHPTMAVRAFAGDTGGGGGAPCEQKARYRAPCAAERRGDGVSLGVQLAL